MKKHVKSAIARSNERSLGNHVISGISMTIALALLFVIAKLFGLAFPYVVLGIVVLVVGATFLLVKSHLN